MSKDNTCPTCRGTRLAWDENPDGTFNSKRCDNPIHGSGQQEDKPSNDFSDFFRNASPEEKGKYISEVVQKANADQKALTDSKPEKPLAQDRVQVEPDQLRELWDALESHFGVDDPSPVAREHIEALISQKLVEELQNLPIGRTPTIQVEIINKRINEIEVSNG